LGPNPTAVELAQAVIATEDRAALMDSLILCKFLRGALGDLFQESAVMLPAVTGWNVTTEELRTTAQRIVTARKCLNIREGWTQAEDILPARLLEGNRLTRERLDAQVRAYAVERGWTERGDVPASLRAKLGLDAPAFGNATS
jgi:aldehyde:ferredoxin oxidoreductase